MIDLQKTSASDPNFLDLVVKLDAELAITDGDDHAFYDQYNKLDEIKYVILAFEDKNCVGCGAIKQFDKNTMEVKRMYVKKDYRGRSIASKILNALEIWAKELGFAKCILETGIRQVDAIALYRKNNYKTINNYGQYIGVTTSVCFEKQLYSSSVP